MKTDPVKYRMLIMQLMTPTPMNAFRHERRASPSSDRPGMAAIKNDLFEKEVATPLVLPMFRRIVHVRRVNLNAAATRTGAAANPPEYGGFPRPGRPAQPLPIRPAGGQRISRRKPNRP